jgi:hypothetical protein
MKNKNQKIQDQTIDKVHRLLKKAGIEAILMVDEDIFTHLDGDDRLSQLTPEAIESIKNDTIDALMDNFAECLDQAIENNL